MSIGTILLIIVVLALVGALPVWPYSRGNPPTAPGWGYYPASGVGVVLLILLVLVLAGAL